MIRHHNKTINKYAIIYIGNVFYGVFNCNTNLGKTRTRNARPYGFTQNFMSVLYAK